MEKLTMECMLFCKLLIHFFDPVRLVSNERVPDRSKMEAYLVGPSSEKIDIYEGILSFKRADDFKARLCKFWVHRARCGHFFSIIRVPANIGFYISSLLTDYSNHQCDIPLLNFSAVHENLKPMHASIVLCYYNKSGSVFIQPVHDAGAFDSSNHREPIHMMQESVHERA